MLTHVHYCKYCDCTFECKATACPHFHEIKNHACGERQDFIRALRFRLGEECKYRCTKPCNHPPKYRRSFRDEEQFPYMRPKVEPVEPLPQGEVILAGIGHAEECCCLQCRKAYRREVLSHA